jgi:squalene-hopene/tetraprenyl-beta-curcumene cyclase
MAVNRCCACQPLKTKLNRRRAVRCSIALLVVTILTVDARAQDRDVDVKATINRGLSFLAKDSVAFKQMKQCYECHHAPFTIWALNEGKKQGYAVDEEVLADMTSWVIGEDFLARLIKERAPEEEIVFNEAPLLLALGIEAGNTNDKQDGLKKLLASVVNDQGKDGSWKRVKEARPILSSPDTLTMLVLLALSAPNAPDLGQEGKTAREKALQWLLTTKPDDELQPTVLSLILWRRLGRPDSEWKPLEQQLRSAQNEDGGWSQLKSGESDAYATGQALYALAEAGVPKDDAAIRSALSFLAKSQREDGAWAMTSRAIMGNGKVATKFEPITHAGSAWAVMGLVRTVPAAEVTVSAASK